MNSSSFLICVFSVFLSLPTFASVPALLEAIDSINAETDLVDQGFYLEASDGSAFDVMLADSETCHRWNEYEETPAVSLAGYFKDVMTEGVTRGYAYDPAKAAVLQSQVDNSVAAFIQTYQNQNLFVCTDSSTPAYSDGHQVTFVKLGENQPLMVLVVGYPD